MVFPHGEMTGRTLMAGRDDDVTMASVVDWISRTTQQKGAGMTQAEVATIESTGRQHLEGADHGNVAISMVVVGQLSERVGPEAHVHPYDEVFVVHEGEATFVVDGETIVAVDGQIVIAPTGTSHKFTNTGSAPLRLTAIHPSSRLIVTQPDA
jgi:mannose-6-phosphate isomerase-like protein (cupin superfamily)